MSYQKKYIKYKNKYLSLKKKQYGGDPIIPEDILFMDDDVCILKPTVKKGILVFTHYTQPVNMQSLCKTGLKTGAQLQSEGIDFGRNMIHPYIFFRAPYLFNPIDYTSIDTEITSSFGEGQSNFTSRAWIRIDPARTYVYSSEIRAKYSPKFYYNSPEYLDKLEQEVKKSRKLITNYLQIINENAKVTVESNQKKIYNLINSRVELVPNNSNISYPWDSNNINRTSEVLVRIPHLTPDYFVKCT